jgi:thymidylate kinase
LITVEGTRGRDVRRAARRLWSALKERGAEGGLSFWDASGAFYEIGLAKPKQLNPSPRTLLLLYATDLAFRLKWQIRPALTEGRSVVAAPYVESAIAFGETAGLHHRWLVELFRFAPPADVCLHVKEKKVAAGWKDRSSDGFHEFANIVLKETRYTWDERRRRAAAVDALNNLGRRRGCRPLKKKSAKEIE